MEFLQNTPLSRENPVKKESIKKAYANLNSNAQFMISALGLASLFFGAVIIMVVFSTIREVVNGEPESLNQLLATDFLIMFIGTSAAITFILFFLKKERNRALNEQLQYYALGQVSPLNIEQRLALRLDLVNAYYHGDWCGSLEIYPCRVRIKTASFKPQSFDIIEKEYSRQQLNEAWGIVSGKQFHKMAVDLFQGMHSRLFAYDIQSDVAENMIEQLAGLTEKDESYVRSCNESKHGKPKKLLWGFDLWRLINMSRDAYMADYISEEEAWKSILKASRLIYFLFDNFEDFQDNYRLGNAFWSNDYNITSDRLKKWKFYKDNCDWDIRQLEWIQPDKVDDIMPEEMKRNFSKYLDDLNRNNIGFKLGGN